jgi:hypothetical protein
MSNIEEEFDENEERQEDQGDAPKKRELSPDEAQEEAYARSLGWVPEEEWDAVRAERSGLRKPVRFMSAREFIDRTESSMPMMRDRLRHQEGMLRDMSGKLDDALNVLVEQRNMNKQAVARAFQRGLEQAAQDMTDAVAEGDMEKHKAAKDTYDKLTAKRAAVADVLEEKPREQRREQPQREEVQLDPVTDAWVQENKSWFYDPSLNQLMIIEHADLRARKPKQEMRASLEEAAANLRRRYPERFGHNPRRDAPGSVLPSSGAKPRTGGHTFDTIPQEDRDAFFRQQRQLKARGVDFTKEEFMAEYAFS